MENQITRTDLEARRIYHIFWTKIFKNVHCGMFRRHFWRGLKEETIKALSVLEKENLYGLVHFPCAKIFDQKNYTTYMYHVEINY